MSKNSRIMYGRSLSAVLFVCLSVFLILSTVVQAQEVTAAISGAVTDSSGAALVGAKVTARDLDRGTLFPTTTNSEGLYNLPRLPVGRYEVRVEASGFQSALKSDVVLQLNQNARIDVQMQVGNVSQSVEVTSAAPLLQTESTQLGTVIDARTNEQLPLATRDYIQLTLLAPGAVTTDPSEFMGSEQTLYGGRPYINGNREEANNFILDGMDNNQVSENGVGYTPSVDAIQEFDMITQNASAEFGNFMGGIVNVSIKSGTNEYHGDAFEFIRNNDLNANNWGNNWNGLARPLLRWNEFGGVVGGPIRKDKLFFFADYQGSRFDQPATSSAFTVLTTQERTGDFSQLLAEGVQLYYPGTKNPIPGNIIPSTMLSPQALKLMQSSLYPSPVNSGLVNNAINTTHSYTNQDQGDIKIDWAASDSDHLFARYSEGHIVQPTTNSVGLLYNSENLYPSYNGVLDYTKTFGPAFVNEARVGVNYIPVVTGELSGTGISAASVGIPNVPTNILPGMEFSDSISGFGNPEVYEEFSDTVIEAEDTAILTRGAHTMRMGFQVFRERLDTFYSGNAGIAGQFDFNGQYTGVAEADFMVGLPDEVQGGIAGGTWGQRSSVLAAFFQDDWHVNRTLTVNLGLRWELNTPWNEVENRQANFGELNGVEYISGQSCPYSDCNALYNQYNGITNFQPRIGIAWQPMNNTVIRAAITTSSFLEGTGTNLRLPLNPPFATEHDITYEASQTPSTLANGYSVFGTSNTTDYEGVSLRLWDPNIRPAVSNQWNLSVQHQFTNSMTLQAGYVGQRNTHLMVPVFANQEILNADGTTSPGYYLSGNPTLKEEIGAAKLTASNGNQDYDALQISFQKRYSKGLELQANYTWSKCMTDSIGYYGGGGQGAGNHWYWQNTFDSAAEWGPCYYDVTHAFNGYVTYDLPFGHGRSFGANSNKVVNAVLGDWQVNTILSFHSGFAMTVLNYEDSSQTHSAGPRADCIAAADIFGELDAPTGGYQWFNPNSYADPALGTFGNCGVGTLRGPGLHTADLSLSKKFNFTEHQNLEFRAEAINFTNTPILNAPNVTTPGAVISDGNFGVGTFGKITSSQGERNIQFGLKYNF